MARLAKFVRHFADRTLNTIQENIDRVFRDIDINLDTIYTTYINQDGTIPMTGDLDMDDNQIINVSNLGIGTDSPSNNIHIQSTTGASVFLEADTDNVDETDTAYLKLSQDGGIVTGYYGFVGANDVNPEGNTYTDALGNGLLISNDNSSGVVQLGVNGAVRATLTAAGDLGIGRNNPAASVHVDNTSPVIRLTDSGTGADNDISGDSSVGGLTLSADLNNEVAGSYVRFVVDGSEYMRVDDTGYIGIGTSSPDATLHVEVESSPELRLSESNTGTSFCSLYHPSSTRSVLQNVCASGESLIDIDPRPVDGTSYAAVRLFRNTDTTGAKSLQFMLGRDNLATVDSQISVDGDDSWFNLSGGNVGIGTNNPSANLDVEGASAEIEINAVSGTGKIQFQENGSDAWSIDQDAVNKLHLSWAGSQKITFDGTGGIGNVGIGTSSPNANSLLHLVKSNDGGFANLLLTNTSTNLSIGAYYSNPSTRYGSINCIDPGGGGEPLVLNSSGGNIGIGLTSPLQTLDVNGDICARGNTVYFSSTAGAINLDYIQYNDGGISGLNTRGGFGFFADTTDTTNLSSANACVACEGVYNSSDYLSATTETFYSHRLDWRAASGPYSGTVSAGVGFTRFTISGVAYSYTLPLRLPKGGTLDQVDLHVAQSTANTTTLRLYRQDFASISPTLISSTTFGHTSPTTVSLSSLAHTIDSDSIYLLQIQAAASSYSIDCYGVSCDVINPVINSLR